MEIEKISRILQNVRGKSLTREERCEASIELASLMMVAAEKLKTHQEKQREKKLARLVSDPAGKSFIVSLIDSSFRSHDTKRVADQWSYLLSRAPLPRFLTPLERLSLKFLQKICLPFHRWIIPILNTLIRREASAVILEENQLDHHLQTRKSEGIRINLNRLGEAILGEEEAVERLSLYCADLARPDIDYISVKISTLYSQVSPLAKEKTLHILGERLRVLYRSGKFVNLDMEEYRDLKLTAELFQTLLSEPEFKHLKAGIVLQSYLPDSFGIQQELTEWALKRVREGGAPIKIRLVKGANLAMEQVEASIKGWPQAPFLTKREVDAQFKRMLEYGCQPDRAHAVHLGIGSHNLFDIAYALLLRSEQQLTHQVQFEMLEGMADSLARVVMEIAGNILLYCPVANPQAFQYAIAYLIRRLDENTAPENFLTDFFALKPGSPAWKRQEMQFREACQNVDLVSSEPRRLQNQLQHSSFHNEPDTDWSLPQNRTWAESLVNTWQNTPLQPPPKIRDIEPLIASAKSAQTHWEKKTATTRSEILGKVASLFRRDRAALLGLMAAETSKTIPEGDPEVSEAIDFLEYYRRNLLELQNLKDIQWHAKGVILVASPWNFSCSIPVGGIAAALAAGNGVLFKPAPEAVSVGKKVAELFWEGGIDPALLHFIHCDDEPVGSALIQHPQIAAVILTGATSTAQLFLQLRPDLNLMAETGGKNSLIITRMADRDLAIRDLIQSAFGYSGQKCSACSLAICEAEVYDDPHFRKTLRDAAASLATGLPWNLATRLNPLIRPPGDSLHRALTQLEEGEEWLLEPKQLSQLLWSPGIKWGVKQGSFTQQTELFGPILGIMRADNLEHAIALANSTPYGLTAGIHTLDEREKQLWLSKIEAGNCYINRGITGAIVLRQPFGGCKASSFGPGAKAGGPHYVQQLMRAEQLHLPEDREPPSEEVRSLGQEWAGNPLWESSIASYAYHWSHTFSKDHDPVHLLGQDNILRYVPRKDLTLWIQEGDAPLDVARVRAAAATCGAHLLLSQDAEQSLIHKLQNGQISRLRCLRPPPLFVYQAAAQTSVTLIAAPPLANGRLELLHYLREVSISHETHRYGNLPFS